MSQAAQDRRIGVIGSHGAVGRMVVRLLRDAGCEVVCGNRTKRTSDEESVIVDARQAKSVRDFAYGCQVVVNCAGPSYIIRDGVANALSPEIIYIDPFGGDLFEDYSGACPSIINAGCTPGLSGLLVRHLSAQFDKCASVTVCSGGREKGGVAGFADVILSTRAGYGYPGRMLRESLPCPYVKSIEEAEDTSSFPEDGQSVRSPFVTEELRRVAVDCDVPLVTGILVVPDSDSLSLLLKAMTFSETDDPAELMDLFTQIDDDKSELDSGKESWFAIQVSARGYVGNSLQRVGITLHARDSSEMSAIFLVQAAFHSLEVGDVNGVRWGYEFLEPSSVLESMRARGIQIDEHRLEDVEAGRIETSHIEFGFM